MLLILNVSR